MAVLDVVTQKYWSEPNPRHAYHGDLRGRCYRLSCVVRRPRSVHADS